MFATVCNTYWIIRCKIQMICSMNLQKILVYIVKILFYFFSGWNKYGKQKMKNIDFRSTYGWTKLLRIL